MSVNLEGQIKGINLTNFLQIVQMEKPTCTLIIRCEKKEGILYILEGEIIDARTNTKEKHLDAAFEILSWEDSSIELKKNMEKSEKFINMPLMNILMEAARFKDEKNASEVEGQFEDEEIDIEEDFLESNEVGDDLDSVTLEMENSLEDEPVIQEIPDEILLEEIDPHEKIESDVDKYNLDADLNSGANLSDFTEDIVLSDKRDDAGFQEEQLFPSIEDYIEKKKPWKKIIAITFLVVAIVCASITGGFLYLKDKNIGKEFAALENGLKKVDYEEQKINLLRKFISRYPDSKYGTKAEKRLNTILNRSQKDSYEILLKNIKKLKIDKNYKLRAEKFYDNFLAKYRSGTYVDKIRNEKHKIDEVIRDHNFTTLKNLTNEKFSEKLVGLKDFKKQYPGIHSGEIDEILENMGQFYLDLIESETGDCNTIEKFELCLKKAEIFKKLFPGHPQQYRAQKLMKTLENKHWSEALLKTARKHADIIAEKKFLEDYIAKHNQYALTIAAQERIRDINYILREKKRYETMMTYASDNSYPIENRITRLKAYLYSETPAQYKEPIRSRLDELEKKRKEILKTVSATPKKVKPAADPKPVQKRGFITEKAVKNVESVKNSIFSSTRFVPVGKFSFKDSLTGKTWTIIDSDDFTNRKCHPFKEAKNLARELAIDGYSDWRLPTEKELLALFKNRPFFPVVKNQWFWSSDVFEKGFNTYSAAVSDKQSEKREKIIKNIFNDCGIFKAVRP